MSFCYDTMAKAWAQLEAQLPQVVRDGEVATRFGLLIEEMHEANHRLGDAINKDGRVTSQARKLDLAMHAAKAENLVLGQCPECFGINAHEQGCSRKRDA